MRSKGTAAGAVAEPVRKPKGRLLLLADTEGTLVTMARTCERYIIFLQRGRE
jgi:hypothetical protein